MTVTHRHTGPPCRFEAALRGLLAGASRRLVRRLIDEGAATLNGRPARKGATVRTGDEIGVPPVPPLAAEPSLPVRIVDVADDLLVLDKPAPMPTLPLDPRERGTLAGFVLGVWPACRDVGGPLAAGVVHRLDTGSSGLVLATRNAALWTALRGAFAARRIHKEYVAVVAGRPPLGAITVPLAHDPRDPRRMIVAADEARAWPAETRVDTVDRHGALWIARVTIRTGVTHQVRAHLASVGAPVVGDPLYGGPSHPALHDRHALHATTIDVPALAGHPGGRWHVALPAELAALG